MEIQKFEKKYMLTFTDNSTIEITEDERNKILSNIYKDTLIFRGNFYKTYRFGEIVDLDEYYNRHPSKRPETTHYTYPNGVPAKMIKDYNSEKAIMGMIKGLKIYIESSEYQGTSAPLDLIAEYEDKLSTVESLQ